MSIVSDYLDAKRQRDRARRPATREKWQRHMERLYALMNADAKAQLADALAKNDDSPRAQDVATTNDEFYCKVQHTDVRRAKAEDCDPEDAIRLLCATTGQAWWLQVRGMMRLASGQPGKDFVVATATLSEEDLRRLRDAAARELDGAINNE